jgi:hypothetical protein
MSKAMVRTLDFNQNEAESQSKIFKSRRKIINPMNPIAFFWIKTHSEKSTHCKCSA